VSRRASRPGFADPERSSRDAGVRSASGTRHRNGPAAREVRARGEAGPRRPARPCVVVRKEAPRSPISGVPHPYDPDPDPEPEPAPDPDPDPDPEPAPDPDPDPEPEPDPDPEPAPDPDPEPAPDPAPAPAPAPTSAGTRATNVCGPSISAEFPGPAYIGW